MTVQQMSAFFALLAVAAELGAVTLVVAAVMSRGGRGPAWATTLLGSVRGGALALAALVATVAMAGSLYFSEVAHFPPCKLCWYQRICMYSLVPLLWLAAWRRDRSARLYAGVLAGIGAVVSCYHILIEHYPELESSNSCDPANPCSIEWVKRFGYLTIPTMALSGFVLILVLMLLRSPAAAHEGAQ